MTPRRSPPASTSASACSRCSGRRAAARHTTLRAAIDWSYELLDDAPAAAVRAAVGVRPRLRRSSTPTSVCAGDGVERADVAGAARRARRPLARDRAPARAAARSTGCSRRCASTRRERLERRGEPSAMRDRHVDHYVRRALELRRGRRWRASTLPFVDEFDELRAALRWCLRDGSRSRPCLRSSPRRCGGSAPARHAEEIARWPRRRWTAGRTTTRWRPRVLGRRVRRGW